MDGEACPAGGWGTRSFGIILGSAPQCNCQFRPRFRRRSCDYIVFCNSVSADRTVICCVKVAWRRGCVRNTIVFAAGPRKSYWSGCIKVAIVI